MAVSRYEIVRRLSSEKRVLEIACGAGQGLGYVKSAAALVVGGDITHSLLAKAAQHYQARIPLVGFDAHHLPFSSRAFDVIELHEAIYYMAEPIQVFRECRRVLRDDGTLIVSTINSTWTDFNPSPYATSYLTVQQLREALGMFFDSVQIAFGFAVPPATLSVRIVSALRRFARDRGLIPSTMKGKTWLKRVFLGPLVVVPPEIDASMAPIDEPQHATDDQAARFRIIYAIARP
jgi:ubiquinone/menaquinone biosynthesis C-methylase UbiE